MFFFWALEVKYKIATISLKNVKGLDFEKTFTTVARLETIRTLAAFVDSIRMLPAFVTYHDFKI
jgi:hypothetical protein